MKTILISALLAVSLSALSQVPNPLSFNTAINSTYTGVLPTVGMQAAWKASNTGIGGPYVPAVRVVNSGWVAPFPKAAWISYPHTCTAGDPSEHGCVTGGPNAGDVEEFYKFTFNLPADICGLSIASSYCLYIDFYADNLVREIYVNNTTTPVWTNSIYNPSAAYNSYNSFTAGAQTSATLCSNWQAGANTIYVRVVSGAPNGTGYTGFMASVNANKTSKDPCDPNPPVTSCCLGNSCTDSQNALTDNYEIPLNNFNFNFSGNGTDKVNVGYNCGLTDIGKFNSTTDKFTSSADGSDAGSISIYGKNLFSGNRAGVGVMGFANNSSDRSGLSVGVWGDAKGNGDNIGGKFFAGTTKASGGTKYNIGVSTVAAPSTGNPPAYTYLSAYPSGANIGIYATGELNNSNDGGSPGPDWAAWFDGDVNVNGNGWITGIWTSSDKRFKKEIKSLENITEKIKKVNSYTYSFRTDEFKMKGFDHRSHIGFIAQELKEVFPELVNEDAKGFLAVDYQGMIPVLLQVVKEQQQQIDELKTLVQSVTGKADSKVGLGTSLPVNLSDKNSIVLNQNVPNPFAESTVISYNLPTVFTKAQIIFTTTEGKVIKSVDILEKGQGTLNVFADDLSHGMYTYKLVVDGKIIDTKKMVKE